jgi:50S ribosome-binding GTPase
MPVYQCCSCCLRVASFFFFSSSSFSTTFNLLSKQSVPAENYPFCTIDPSTARVAVPDKRFDWLVEKWKPPSSVSAQLEIHDIAGLVKGASTGEGLGNAFLSHIRAVDGIYHVIRRCFFLNVPPLSMLLLRLFCCVGCSIGPLTLVVCLCVFLCVLLSVLLLFKLCVLLPHLFPTHTCTHMHTRSYTHAHTIVHTHAQVSSRMRMSHMWKALWIRFVMWRSSTTSCV